MSAHYLNIEARERRNAGFIASLNDFTVSDGDEVDAGIILSNPNVSLYAFDDENKRAIFVELPANVNLAAVPFVYMTQFEEAQRLIAVPYENFLGLAQSLPPVEHLIMMYISGRSGSTLLHHVFNELDDVISLSEPDVITQFIHMRPADHSRDAELRELFDGTVRILFKPNPYKTVKTYVLKYRSETIQAMDLFHTTFPHSKNLYLYREAEGFVRSFYRVFRGNEASSERQPVSELLAGFEILFNCDLTAKRAYLDADNDQVSMVEWLTLWWMIAMDWYREQAAHGIPVMAIRYADLNASREQVLKAIFDYCDLPTDQVSKALGVFDRDSQAGTFLARENPTQGNKLQFTPAQIDEMNRILARHPIIQQSDFIAPNTLRI